MKDVEFWMWSSSERDRASFKSPLAYEEAFFYRAILRSFIFS
jgi:hypothetical protein